MELLVEQKPTIEEYMRIRRIMGWGDISPESAQQTLNAATFTVCLREGVNLAGLLRIVGDGVLYIFVADVMVRPEYAGKGLGNRLMQAAISYIDEVADPVATVTLVPMPGSESFYERFGFVRCPNKVFGEGMAYLKHTNVSRD